MPEDLPRDDTPLAAGAAALRLEGQMAALRRCDPQTWRTIVAKAAAARPALPEGFDPTTEPAYTFDPRPDRP